MILFALSIMAFLLVGNLVKSMGASAEWTRKFVHIGVCLCIAFYPYFDISRHQLTLIAAVFTVLMFVCRGTWVTRSIAHVERTSYGEVMLPASVAITSMLDLNHQAFVCAYLVLGFSDSLASLVGQRFGKTPLPLLRHGKTYAGSLAFLSSCVFILLFTAWFVGIISWPVVVLLLGLSVVITFTEAISYQGSDNLYVPVTSVMGVSFVIQAAA